MSNKINIFNEDGKINLQCVENPQLAIYNGQFDKSRYGKRTSILRCVVSSKEFCYSIEVETRKNTSNFKMLVFEFLSKKVYSIEKRLKNTFEYMEDIDEISRCEYKTEHFLFEIEKRNNTRHLKGNFVDKQLGLVDFDLTMLDKSAKTHKNFIVNENQEYYLNQYHSTMPTSGFLNIGSFSYDFKTMKNVAFITLEKSTMQDCVIPKMYATGVDLNENAVGIFFKDVTKLKNYCKTNCNEGLLPRFALKTPDENMVGSIKIICENQNCQLGFTPLACFTKQEGIFKKKTITRIVGRLSGEVLDLDKIKVEMDGMIGYLEI